jgi:hypothetical protein
MNFMKRRNTLTTLALLAAVSHLAATTGPTAYADKKEGGDSNYIDDDGNDDDGDDEASSHKKNSEHRDDEGEANSEEVTRGPSGTAGGLWGSSRRGVGGSQMTRILFTIERLKIYLRVAFPQLYLFLENLFLGIMILPPNIPVV